MDAGRVSLEFDGKTAEAVGDALPALAGTADLGKPPLQPADDGFARVRAAIGQLDDRLRSWQTQ